MTKIFLETSSKNNEFIFIADLIFHFCHKVEGKDYIIITTGGKSKLDSQRNLFFDHEDKSEKNVVIFDADFPLSEKNDNGGYEHRSKFLSEKIKSWNIEIPTEIFLFPNNHDDGIFENLLEKIVQPEHLCILNYFKEYEDKLNSHKDKSGECKYNSPDQKARIYAYASAVKKRSNKEYEFFKRGDWSFLDSRYWDLNCDYMKPLKNFLINIFNEAI